MDIDRRRFITGCTTSAVAVLTGCSAFDSDSVAPTDQNEPTATTDQNEPSATTTTDDSAAIIINDVQHVTEAQHNDAIEVTAQIENTGGESGADTVVLRLDESVVDAKEVTVDGSETLTTQFTIPADDIEPGTHSLTVSTNEDSSTSQLTIADPAPASLQITGVDIPSVTAYDEPVTVTVTVNNVGELTAEQEIRLQANESTVTSASVSVAGGEETTKTLTVPADEYFDGEYRLTIATDDDERTSTVRIDNPNPYGQETLVVGLEQQTPARHDMQDIVINAITYWEENAATYTGFPINYEYRPNATDPDVEIIVVEQILDCGEHTGEEVAGCAPLITDGVRVPETATIRIVDGYRKRWMTTTLKHEFGHTLGLDHGAEPQHIMSNNIRDRIPHYEERRAAIDSYLSSFVPYNDGDDAWSRSVDAWNSSNYQEAETAARNAYNHWLESQQAIRAARNTAESLNEDTAYDLVYESEQHVNALRNAADAAITMTQEAQKTYGDSEPHRKESNNYLDESREYTFHDSEKITRAFGFPSNQ